MNPERIDDLPPSTLLRRDSHREPFPPCKALRRWPANYPVGDLADLDEEEAAEADPSKFVYSDAELEGWRTIVNSLLDETSGPTGWRRRHRAKLPKPAHGDDHFRDFLARLHPSLFRRQQA